MLVPDKRICVFTHQRCMQRIHAETCSVRTCENISATAIEKTTGGVLETFPVLRIILIELVPGMIYSLNFWHILRGKTKQFYYSSNLTFMKGNANCIPECSV